MIILQYKLLLNENFLLKKYNFNENERMKINDFEESNKKLKKVFDINIDWIPGYFSKNEMIFYTGGLFYLTMRNILSYKIWVFYSN
jgi:hypothetical protein